MLWFPAVGFNLAHVGELLFKCHQIVKAEALAATSGAQFESRVMEKIIKNKTIHRLNLVQRGGEDEPHEPGSAFSVPEDQ